MEAQLPVALELLADALEEFPVRVQARHLVFVLVGQQLEVVARHRQRQALGAGGLVLGVRHLVHQVGVQPGVGGVLVLRQERAARLDHALQFAGRFLQFHHRTSRARAADLDDAVRMRRHAAIGQKTRDAGQVMRGAAPPGEGRQVVGHLLAVQLDGAQQRLARQRQPALLVGVAHHQRIGIDGVAQQPHRQRRRIHRVQVVLAAGGLQVGRQVGARQRPVGVGHERRGRRGVAIEQRARAARPQPRHGVGAGGHHQVAGQHQVGLAHRHAGVHQVVRRLRQHHVRIHRAALLRQAGHVQHRTALAFQVRGHAQQLADGDHAGAAHAGDEDAIGLRQRRQRRLRHVVVDRAFRRQRARLAQLAALHRDEAGAEALQTGEVLVAAGLVDGALAPELGLQRLHRQAMRFLRTIATAFAHAFVDDHAPRRVGIGAALAAAALLGGTGLVVDQYRHAGVFAQFAHHRVQLVAMPDRHARRHAGHALVFLRLVGHHHDLVDAFGRHLAADHRHADGAVDRLPAGHGHRVVEQDLVGDRRLGRHRRADRQQARMEVGAVAEVGEHVLFLGERRLPQPRHALAAHLRVHLRVAAHPGHHVVAADAGHAARAFRHPRRGIVRTARTEPRLAVFHHARARQRLLTLGDEGQARLDAGAHVGRQFEAQQARGNGLGHHRRRELVMRRQQPVALRHRPFAAILVVELADHARDLLTAADPAEQFLLQLVFEHLALFLDHQDLVQAIGEARHAGGLQRPHHADLEQPQADALAHRLAQPQVGQRLTRIQVGLARGHDAEARVARRHLPQLAVQVIGAGVGQRRVQLVVQQPRLLLQGRVRDADVKAVRRQLEIPGQHDLHTVRIHVHRGRHLDDVGDALHPDPDAGIAAHGPAVQAVVQHFLHAGGEQRRDHAGLEDVVALVRQRRRLGRMVIAGHHQHAAVRRRAGGVGVLEHVAAAVHARPLAVPHAEHAVVLGAREQVDLLRAPHRGGRQVLVDARLELDVVRLQVLGRLPHVLVDPAQRRAPVARHEPGRVQPRAQVAQPLHHRQAHQGMDAAHPGAAAFQGVFVVQLDGFERRAQRGREGGIHVYSEGRGTPAAANAPRPLEAHAGKRREVNSGRSMRLCPTVVTARPTPGNRAMR
ncbi:Uncharacterised protein [Achromobacter xylosoxidans]|nr:Uncharacterised protein [Achromobacter xylosoxidans]